MPRAPRAPALIVVVAAALAARGEAFAAREGENRDKKLLAVRTGTPPTIDGRLDDASWADAPPDDRFLQAFPQDGAAPTERTEVRVLYDDDAIYVGIRCEDRQAGRIVARLTRRDRWVESDQIAVGFDSRHDHSTAYVFELNAAGVQSDYALYDDTNMTRNWDAVWDGEVTRDAGGWTAEYRIPLRALRFSSADVQEWGFSVRRTISRKKETDNWSYVPQEVNAEVSRWGHLVGLRGLKPRRALELRPFGVSRMRAATDRGGAFLGQTRGADHDGSFDVGIDVKYGITSNLTFDATVNPDFGQVEADQVVLNLSRFESFFPEKRPFFLEGADIFQTPIQVFYSRRIGRPPSGLGAGSWVRTADDRWLTVTQAPLAVPIWSALKLSGKLGSRTTIGVVEAITAPEVVTARDEAGGLEDLERAPARSFAVVRGRWSPGGASYLGFMATAVNRLGGNLARGAADHDAWVQSLDGQYVTSSGRFSLGGQALLSERVGGPSRITDGGVACPAEPAPGESCVPITRADGTRMEPGAVGYGGMLRASYQGNHWVGDGVYRSYSPYLDVNDLGFLQQFNQHSFELGGGYRELKPKGRLQNWSLTGGGGYSMNYDGVATGGGFNVRWNALYRNFIYQAVQVGFGLPGGWDPYETGDGAYFERQLGADAWTWIETDSRKRVMVSAGGGAFFSFNTDNYTLWSEGSVALRLVPQLELDLGGNVMWDMDWTRSWFYGGCVDDTGAGCTVESDRRIYRFGDLDSGVLSLTARGTYTFSTRLSVQGYAQLFMSQGEFDNRRSIETTGARPYIRRGELMADPTFTGDLDGDGVVDDAFQDTSLNVNVVLRWELVPGTTLMGVYTRAQQGAYELAGRHPAFRVAGLARGPTEEVLLLKLTYYWS